MQQLAKSNPSQTIQRHTEDTIRISKKLSEYAGCDDQITPYMFVAALFHDIGKVTSDFQKHLADETHKAQIPHNLVSFMIMKDYIRPIGGNLERYKAAMKAVLLHHPIEERGNKNENTQIQYIGENRLADIDFLTENDHTEIRKLAEWAVEYNNKHNVLQLEIIEKDDVSWGQWAEWSMPFICNTSTEFRRDDYYLAISGNLKCADTLASRCNDGTINECDIESYYKLSLNISVNNFHCPSHYDEEIFNEQVRYVERIVARPNGFDEINEPVGFGKTDVMLMSALCLGKKILYVLPTNATAINGYYSVIDFLNTYGLNEKVSVGLLLTNEWIEGKDKEDFNDIIVTNIDNTLRPLFKSDKRKRMAYDLCYRTMVVDEYHLYFSKSALMRGFKVTMNARSSCHNVKTLLSSATPMECLLAHNDVNSYVPTKAGCDKRRLRIHYSAVDYKVAYSNVCTVVNSVSQCQALAREFRQILPDRDYIAYHSRFVREDRKAHEDRIFAVYGKDSNTRSEDKPCVFATNVISTGINVSFKTMILYGMPLFELYQCMGRCNRWGEYDIGDIYINLKDMNERNEQGAIKAKWDHKLCQKEMALLKKNLPEGEYTIPQIHDIMLNIMSEVNYVKQMNLFIPNSTKALSMIPYRYGVRKDNDKDVEMISSLPTLRDGLTLGKGEELFVWCKGMEEGTYIRAFIKENYLSLDGFANEMIRKNKLRGPVNTSKLKADAKDSRHPLILRPDYYRYTKSLGFTEQEKE